MDGVLSVLTEQTVDGVALWVVALICVGVFLASFMDAIAGGGGIISVPTYLMALHTLPTYYALGTNKLSACIGTVFSTGRYIRGGYVEWRLFGPAAALSLLGSLGGTWLQHRTPDTVLKYLLLVVLPVVAVLTLRGHSWPDEAAPVPPVRRAAVVSGGCPGNRRLRRLLRTGDRHVFDAGLCASGGHGYPAGGRRDEGDQLGVQPGGRGGCAGLRIRAGQNWFDFLRGSHCRSLFGGRDWPLKTADAWYGRWWCWCWPCWR